MFAKSPLIEGTTGSGEEGFLSQRGPLFHLEREFWLDSSLWKPTACVTFVLLKADKWDRTSIF